MEEFVAGAIAGSSGLIIGHPMEVLKVHLQIQQPSVTNGAAVFESTGGLRIAASAILRRRLSEGAFRGLTLPLVSFTTTNAVFFGVYGHTLTTLETLRPSCHHGNVALAGMAAGAAQLPLVTPIEVVKTAMQAQLTRRLNGSEFYRGPLHCGVSILRREGPRGLARGFAVTLTRDIPSYGLYMLTYDWLSRVLTGHVTSEAAATLLAGGLAGSIGWLSILPIDTVKSNLQAQAGSAHRQSGLAVARQLYASQGVRGFYRGGAVVTLRSFPVNAVTFFVWQHTLQLMKRMDNKESNIYDCQLDSTSYSS